MIDKLEMFMILEREGHFGRAAAAYGVTQPTLSSAIRALEKEFGVQLVWRGSRFQGLTPEGLRVLDHARRIVAEARALRDDMREARHGVAGHLRIGAIPTALPRVARLTGPFLMRNPAARITVLSCSAAEIRAGLVAQDLDAGITYAGEEMTPDPAHGGAVSGAARSAGVRGDGSTGHARFDWAALWPERYCLLERGTDTSEIGWAEAAMRPLCLLTPDMQNRQLIDAQLTAAGAEVVPRVESNSSLALLSHVASGHWSAILAEALGEGIVLPPGCVARPLSITGPEQMVGLAVMHRPTVPPSLRALIEEARRLCLPPPVTAPAPTSAPPR